ncbi:PadR family transcriptional regulator [Streptomyces sp. B1866]|uniref:PadR family transcriptional regulator n=1 Tax=Streptomyces sp. B1866 TaxID=3075431 RepID=UPI00288D6101|nr:PadR family transcriptional regulator [Streptomyces sp. B1866]MDT3396565.1 PadR family transcriptional regulator [Streptomyces sp. B1866]
MALEHAILVSLQERSGSGYELARRFDKSFAYFWAASHQQIYRTLKRMVDLGWVGCESVPQEDRPDKKVYRATGEGRAELARWIAEPAEPSAQRNDLAVKIRGASYGDPGEVVAEVARHRAHHAERLAVYREIERRDFPRADGLTGQRLHQYLVLRGGILMQQGLVGWCDELLESLRREHPRGADESGRP